MTRSSGGDSLVPRSRSLRTGSLFKLSFRDACCIHLRRTVATLRGRLPDARLGRGGGFRTEMAARLQRRADLQRGTGTVRNSTDCNKASTPLHRRHAQTPRPDCSSGFSKRCDPKGTQRGGASHTRPGDSQGSVHCSPPTPSPTSSHVVVHRIDGRRSLARLGLRRWTLCEKTNGSSTRSCRRPPSFSYAASTADGPSVDSDCLRENVRR